MFFIIILFSLLSFNIKAAEPSIIINSSNKVVKMRYRDVVDIFIGNTKRWENGDKIILVLMPIDSYEMRELLSWIGVTSYNYNKYMGRLSSDTVGESPIFAKNEDDLKNSVRDRERAIAFISNHLYLYDGIGLKKIEIIYE